MKQSYAARCTSQVGTSNFCRCRCQDRSLSSQALVAINDGRNPWGGVTRYRPPHELTIRIAKQIVNTHNFRQHGQTHLAASEVP